MAMEIALHLRSVFARLVTLESIVHTQIVMVLEITFQPFAVVVEIALHLRNVIAHLVTLEYIVHTQFVMELQATFQLFAVVMEIAQHQIFVNATVDGVRRSVNHLFATISQAQI